MGNRAIIVASQAPSIGVYLHWNGEPESVLAFLAVARTLGVRDPVSDPAYFVARLVQIVANYFGGTLSVGVGDPAQMDDSDNGLYVVGAGFAIVFRNGGRPCRRRAGRPRAGEIRGHRL